MEQVNSGMNDVNDLPESFPTDKEAFDEELAADQLTADLLKEQAEGPISMSDAPGEGEDVVLLVETVSLSDEPGADSLSAEEQQMLKEMGLDEGNPWYRSPWFYMGASLVGGAALATGAVLLLRNRKKQPRTTLGRAQNVLGQWSNQLGDQAGRLTKQANKLSRQIKKSPSRSGSFTGQMNKLTDQAQDQINQLAKRTQRNGLAVLPLQRQSGANKWMKQTRHQLNDFSQQVGEQLTSLGNAIGVTSTQALDKTQEGLLQAKRGVAVGVAKTGEGIQTGWKLSRNFTLGMAAGAVWAAVFTPQNGETTRQHLSAIFQRDKTRKR
jgi:hypothetical protein